MGDPEGWPQPSGLLPEGSSSCAALFSSLDDERWLQAENRTLELITRIQPTKYSEDRRRAVADYVQRLIRKCFDCEVFTFGSVPLKTYLPDGDIDLTAFSRHQHLKETWANEVRSVLEAEERSKDAEFRVKEVQYIQAEVKIIKCLVENIVVDISFNQLGGLCTLCFLEEVDRLIGRDHLFKRSIILVKAWCYYESRILGAHHGLISTYALETLVLYIFHVFHASLRGPLGVLFRFLEFFSNFDWDKYCVSLWGPIPLSALPDMPAEPPRKDGGELLLSKAFLEACGRAYAVVPNGNTVQTRVFGSKYLNVVDPLKTTNNLGRSVSKGNFFRIRSAFSFGARKLARILECPLENVVDELDKFFLNTWDRHGSGRRPDAPEPIERISSIEEKAPSDGKTSTEKNLKDNDDHRQLAGELLQELNDFAIRSQHSDEVARIARRDPTDLPDRLKSLALETTPEVLGSGANHIQETGSLQGQRRYSEVGNRTTFDDRNIVDDHEWTARDLVNLSLATDSSTKSSTLWESSNSIDVPPFYPRSVHATHPKDVMAEDIHTTEQAGWDNAPYNHSNPPHLLPVPGPPPPPLTIHPTSPAAESPRLASFGSQTGGYLPMPLLRGPVPPPLPPYGRSGTLPQRGHEGGHLDGGHYSDEGRQERDKEPEDVTEHTQFPPHIDVQVPQGLQPPQSNTTRSGSKELSPDAPIFYEQNGSPLEEEECHSNERKTSLYSSRTKGQKPSGSGKVAIVDEVFRVADGTIPPTGESWPVLDPAFFQYSAASNPVAYSGLSAPASVTDNTGSIPASPSSGASSPVSYPLQRTVGHPPPSIGIPVGPSGFVRAETAATGAHSRKQRQADTQAVPSFYYSPFSYVPLYPFYVLPPEAGDGEALKEMPTVPMSLQEDGQTVPQLMYGVGERLAAAGIPVSAGGKLNGDRSPDTISAQDGRYDLLRSDFANHLRNLDYGRACQLPGPIFLPQPAFPPFPKELQGHYIWEGPGRPVPNNMGPMKHGSSSSRLSRGFHRAFPGPPGFNGDDVSKARAGTGTYLPGTRQTYRERQFKGQHDGYQDREYTEREAPPRYQRSIGRGQNNRVGQGGGKHGDKGWHENFNRNSAHILPVSGSPTTSVLTPAPLGMNLEAYSQAWNGNSPSGPVILVYPSEPLEFGTLGSMQSPDPAAGRGSSRAQHATLNSGNDKQQPLSPKSQQRTNQRTYQMKEEDFPPLSFRAQGSSSSSGSGAGTRSSPYQTYVASPS